MKWDLSDKLSVDTGKGETLFFPGISQQRRMACLLEGYLGWWKEHFEAEPVQHTLRGGSKVRDPVFLFFSTRAKTVRTP